MEDGEDGNLYTGIPILNKKSFEQEVNSVINYHLTGYCINNDNSLDLTK